MKRLKQQLLPGAIITVSFLLLFLMSTMIQSQLTFFSAYQTYYEKSFVKIDVQGLRFDGEEMIRVMDEVLDDTSFVQFYLPMYDAETSLMTIYPQGAIQQLNDLEISAQTTPYLIAGKDAYQAIAKDIHHQQLVIYDTQFAITGLLPQSPFNQNLILYADKILTDARYQSNITAIVVSSAHYDKAQNQLQAILAVVDESDYMSAINDLSAGLNQQNMADIVSEYQQLFMQLLLIILLCMGIHYYQRFDLWRLEFAVRKMAGAHTFQLVIDTFKKFLFLTTWAFVSACIVYFGIVRLFPWFLPLTAFQRWLALLHVCALYTGLLGVFFLLSIWYVRKVSVTAMFMEVDE